MFKLQTDLSFIDFRDKNLLTVIQSINQPMVAAGDFPAEETQAYIVSVQHPDRSIETFIYLHLMESNRAVIYRHDKAPFFGDILPQAENEAVDFVESMGFMMDNLRFTKLSPEERQNIFREIPLFYINLKDFAPILQQKRAQKSQEELGEVSEPSVSGARHVVSALLKSDEEDSKILADLEIVEEEREVEKPRAEQPKDLEVPEQPEEQTLKPVPVEEWDGSFKSTGETEDFSNFFSSSGGKQAPAPEVKLPPPPEVAIKDDVAGLRQIEQSLVEPTCNLSTSAPPAMQSQAPQSAKSARELDISPKEWQELVRLLLSL